jgi:hypothetical protein
MSKAETKQKKEAAIIVKYGIHTEDELTELLCQENGLRDPIDTV